MCQRKELSAGECQRFRSSILWICCWLLETHSLVGGEATLQRIFYQQQAEAVISFFRRRQAAARKGVKCSNRNASYAHYSLTTHIIIITSQLPASVATALWRKRAVVYLLLGSRTITNHHHHHHHHHHT
jgi:hypothetical protein